MKKDRWTVALAGMLLMMSLGTIYSWSLYTQPLICCFGWSTSTTTCAFSLAIFFLGIGALAGGRLQDRFGPRNVALTGAVLWGAGNVLAGLGTPYFGAAWLYLTYGAMGGFGVGMGYVTSVAVVTKWFPEQRGLGSGIVLTGFGLGAVAYNLIVKNLPSFRSAAIAASQVAKAAQAGAATRLLAAGQMHAVMKVLTLSGIGFCAVGVVGAWLLDNPTPAAREAAEASTPLREDSYTPRQMLATRQFYCLWSMMFLNVTAGILLISNALPLLQELTGASPAAVAGAYGSVALFNTLGRFFWAAISDRIGRTYAFSLIFMVQAVVFLLMGSAHGLIWAVSACAVILLCYGGGFGTMPSLNADYFGTRHMGANYGVLLTAWGAAGVAGPLFAAAVNDAKGAFSGALPVVATVLAIATVLPLVTRKPAARALAS
ncbi:MAG TPA: OFA family MFS transporter [Burkholderiaceae bacterium]|nr:OFA family MFS transporter [Burkholderiaceae bacterium]